jgi:hypothetical protein
VYQISSKSNDKPLDTGTPKIFKMGAAAISENGGTLPVSCVSDSAGVSFVVYEIS